MPRSRPVIAWKGRFLPIDTQRIHLLNNEYESKSSQRRININDNPNDIESHHHTRDDPHLTGPKRSIYKRQSVGR